MPIKCCKFGGTSLADASQFRKVASIVRADPDRRYVVPSAPGKRDRSDQKITDLLYLCHEHARQRLPFDSIFDLIRRRYLDIVADLTLSLDLRPALDEIESRIAAGESADYTASRGEHLSGLIVAALLDFPFVDPADIIHFDPTGRFDPDATQTSASARLLRESRAVVPGFYGSLPDGRVKTFSRGGSDISGSIVARAVHAEVYENWTDVSGLLMADPRIVDNPRPIRHVTYKELRELAYMGATVLHDEAVFPVRQAGIPVNIRNTNDPADPGTLILRDSDAPPRSPADPPITGIAGRKDFTVIAIEKALANAELGFVRRILEAVESNAISFEHLPSGIDTVSLVIADRQLQGKTDQLLADIRAAVKPDELELQPHMALIATVGRGMLHTPGMASRLLAAVAAQSINIRMIDQGSSELNIIIGVDAHDFERAVRAIYHAFVNP